MNLRDLAKPHTTNDGAITWYMIPFRTLRDKHIRAAFEKILPFEEWDNTAHAFCLLEQKALEIDFADTSDPEILRFRAYWQSRPSSMAERWQTFMVCASDTIYDAFSDAFFATRDEQIAVAVNDPESQASVENNSSNDAG